MPNMFPKRLHALLLASFLWHSSLTGQASPASLPRKHVEDVHLTTGCPIYELARDAAEPNEARTGSLFRKYVATATIKDRDDVRGVFNFLVDRQLGAYRVWIYGTGNHDSTMVYVDNFSLRMNDSATSASRAKACLYKRSFVDYLVSRGWQPRDKDVLLCHGRSSATVLDKYASGSTSLEVQVTRSCTLALVEMRHPSGLDHF